MAAHAKIFSPSASDKWLNCLASVKLEEGLPNESSSEARWGTCAHMLSEHVLADASRLPDQFLGTTHVVEGETIEVTQEMIDVVTSYTSFVRHLVETTGGQLFVETRVDFRNWLPPGVGDDDGFGSSDAIIVAGDELIVVDLKAGAGVSVDAVGSNQMRIYALGAYAEHSLMHDFKQVRMIIVQPRNGGVKEWTQTVDELLAFGEYVRERASLIVAGGNLPATPGKKNCKWCRASGKVNADGSWRCPTQAAEVLSTMYDGFDDLTATKLPDLPNLPAVWEKLDFIEAWIGVVRTTMHNEVKAGTFPEYKLVEGRKGHRAWGNPDEVVEALKAARLKKEEMYDFKLISPASAEKLLAKEKPRVWKKVQELITQPPGKETVAPISDPRPALAKPTDGFEVLDTVDLFS